MARGRRALNRQPNAFCRTIRSPNIPSALRQRSIAWLAGKTFSTSSWEPEVLEGSAVYSLGRSLSSCCIWSMFR
jgi:hypothetical protein